MSSKSKSPRVSVVMGVYNAAETIEASLQSLCQQTYKDFEILVVDDGSTDSTPKILAQIAQNDPRLHVIRQANSGLTASLITGCERAQGEFIARQDADDYSLPNRLSEQLKQIERNPEIALVTSWVEDVSDEGHSLEIHRDKELRLALPSGRVIHLPGVPAHGSVMMRRTAFETVGGYRKCFYYAQDSDLWLRLHEAGSFITIPEVLYRRTIASTCISSRFRTAQSSFCRFAQESYFARQVGKSDSEILQKAMALAEECRRTRQKAGSRYDQATTLMLMASQLVKTDRKGAKVLLNKAFRICPWHLRVWKAQCLQYLSRS